MNVRRIVAISDYCSQVPPEPVEAVLEDDGGEAPLALAADVAVRGGYLERLPLAVVRAGWADCAEIWDFAGSDGDQMGVTLSPYGLACRRFRAEGHPAPYGSLQMVSHLRRHGAPDILCVWGLGVREDILRLCDSSIRIYNSLDVDALRIPPEVSRHIDVFLTGSVEQEDEIRRRHPGAVTAMLPIGPDFASPETFRPLDIRKTVDLIYVAAAQPYKRHDILFDAMAGLPGTVSALCVMGYGEDAQRLRDEAVARGLNISFVGPPGVSHDEVNRLMNTARIGLVCGENDGAPAILTEYMLAGLPVLANERLRCGLQYIRPTTGMTAAASDFGQAILQMLAATDRYGPRHEVLDNWSWPHSVDRLGEAIATARARRKMERVA